MSTNIQWTDESWNCVTGCTKISAGCRKCYAEIMTRRLKAMGQEKYQAGFDKVVCHKNCLNEPFKWTKPRMIFVCSMSDLFHKDVPDGFIFDVFHKIQNCPRHTFQILTKRAERLAKLSTILPLPSNLWLGVTVENQAEIGRIDYLRHIPARVKFISFEPLLSLINWVNLDGIQWAIIGCESGTGRRHIGDTVIQDLAEKCKYQGVPVFIKQIANSRGKVLKDIKEFPKCLQIRQWPVDGKIRPLDLSKIEYSGEVK